MRVSSDTRNVLMLGLVYDFILYAAEHLNVDIINRKTIVRLNTRCHLLAFAAKVEKQLQATVSIQ